jgi:alkylation response protein AidB-like acyl-CoA dehydrogenase
MANAGSTYMEFDDVVIPAANLLGRENQGFEIIMSSAWQLLVSRRSFLGCRF